MDVFSVPTNFLSARLGILTRITGGSAFAIELPLIIDRLARELVRLLPTGITADSNARGADHLVRCNIEIYGKRPELAVKLARRIQRAFLPAIAVVHHHLRIPLRKVETTSLPSLPARSGRGTSIPVHIRHQGVT